jgi:hypothetical protein
LDGQSLRPVRRLEPRREVLSAASPWGVNTPAQMGRAGLTLPRPA